MKLRLFTIMLVLIGVVVLLISRQSYMNKIEAMGNVTSTDTNAEIEEPTDETSVVFFGDSLTANGKWHRHFPDAETLNQGVSGNKTTDLLDRLPESVESNPEHLFIMVGINDLWTHSSNEEILNNYNSIIEEAKSLTPETTIYLQSILPVNPIESLNSFPNNPFPEDISDRIAQINTELENIASSQGVQYIDLYNIYSENGYVKDGLTYDGVHLIEDAYQLWVAEIKEFIIDKDSPEI